MSIEGTSLRHDRGTDGRYYTVAEAAQKLKVSHATVWRWIDAGKLPAYRVGPKTIRIQEQDLQAVIAPVTTMKPTHSDDPAEEHASSGVHSRARALAGPRMAPLTDDEVTRRLAALERATVFRRAQLASRGGVPFSSSTELIRQTREELGDRV
jgi:excisionase family DNA binding protein